MAKLTPWFLLSFVLMAIGLYEFGWAKDTASLVSAKMLTQAAQLRATEVSLSPASLALLHASIPYHLDKDATVSALIADEISQGVLDSRAGNDLLGNLQKMTGNRSLRVGPLLTNSDGIQFPCLVSDKIMARTGGDPRRQQALLCAPTL
jgi:hypothetical protein